MRVPFGQLFMDFLGSLTNFDTKLWSTLKVIGLRPGQLTKDYVEGKRARYVVPGRFYLFVSVIFFALLNVLLDRNMEERESPVVSISEGSPEFDRLRRSELNVILGKDRTRSMGWAKGELNDLDIELPIDAPHYRKYADRLRPASDQVLDSLLQQKDTLSGARARLRNSLALLPEADSLNTPFRVLFNGLPAAFDDRDMQALFEKGRMNDAVLDSLIDASGGEVNWLERRIIRSFGQLDLEKTSDKRRLARAAIGSTSLIMFLLMPFAAVLLLWSFDRKRYYWEHLIFSLHVHTILFLYASLYMGVAMIGSTPWPRAVHWGFFSGCLLYLLFALRRVYGRPWPSTLLRTLLMAVPYTLVMAVLLAAGFLWGLINL